MLARLVHASDQLAHLLFKLRDAGIARAFGHLVRQRLDLRLKGRKARLQGGGDGVAQRLHVDLQLADLGAARLDVGDAVIERVDELDQPLRMLRRLDGERDLAQFGSDRLEFGRRNRHAALDRVEAIIDAAQAFLDRVHRGLEAGNLAWAFGLVHILDLQVRQSADRSAHVIQSSRHAAEVGALAVVPLQLSQARYRRGHVVETTVQCVEVDPWSFGDQRGKARDMAFEALNLPGLAYGARQQLHHVAQLAHLIGDLAYIRRLAARLRLEFGLEPLEPFRNAAHRVRQLVEARRVRCRSGRLRRRWLLEVARPNLLDCGLQCVARILSRRVDRVPVAELVDGALYRAQRLAVAGVGLYFGDAVAQVAHPLGQPVIGRLRPHRAGDLGFNLIEQRDQFAAQLLPFASAGLAEIFLVERGSRAGHRSIPST